MAGHPAACRGYVLPLLLLLAEGSRRVHAHRQGVGGGGGVAESCRYLPPPEAGDGGYEDMENLTKADWSATDGTQADGRHVLFYAYGHMFRGRGQIAAWIYDHGMIKQWWSKKSCMGMTTTGCEDGAGNMPSATAFLLNPSASVNDDGDLEYMRTYAPGELVSTPVGDMELVKVGGNNYRLMTKGCYLDHVYVCGKSDFIPILKTPSGGECPEQFFVPSFGPAPECQDHSTLCDSWVQEGRCESDKDNMRAMCSLSCKVCQGSKDADQHRYWQVDPKYFVGTGRRTFKHHFVPDFYGVYLAGSVGAMVIVGLVAACCWKMRRQLTR